MTTPYPLLNGLKSINDLILIDFVDPVSQVHQQNFLWVTEDDVVFFGRALGKKMTLGEYVDALRPVPDEALFPLVPEDQTLTIAVDDETPSFCKRPGLFQFDPKHDTGTPKLVLEETLIMETLARTPHPNIIHYKGCRVRRGRITGIVLERHQLTLEQFVDSPDFEAIDQGAFLGAVESAVVHLHALGLAHNDINPGNIMVDKTNKPILIDFGSCQPFGQGLQTFGTPGWVDEDFFVSDKKHDIFALDKLTQWMEDSKSKTRRPKSEL